MSSAAKWTGSVFALVLLLAACQTEAPAKGKRPSARPPVHATSPTSAAGAGAETASIGPRTNAAPRPLPSSEPLEFALPNLKGEVVRLSRWRGHPVVLDVWATWCPPCRKEIPELNQLYRKYRRTGLVVVGLSADSVQGGGVAAVRAFLKKFKVEYPIVMADEKVLDYLHVEEVPTTFFLGPDGTLRYRVDGAGRTGELTAYVLRLIGNKGEKKAG